MDVIGEQRKRREEGIAMALGMQKAKELGRRSMRRLLH